MQLVQFEIELEAPKNMVFGTLGAFLRLTEWVWVPCIGILVLVGLASQPGKLLTSAAIASFRHILLYSTLGSRFPANSIRKDKIGLGFFFHHINAKIDDETRATPLLAFLASFPGLYFHGKIVLMVPTRFGIVREQERESRAE